MPLPTDPDPQVFLRVKGALKTIGMSQRDLAKHLGLAPGVVSLALSGGNEKTFRRIIDMLEQEHGIDPSNCLGKANGAIGFRGNYRRSKQNCMPCGQKSKHWDGGSKRKSNPQNDQHRTSNTKRIVIGVYTKKCNR
nr:helix-turn-helix transcriptional regulator [Haliscomenobacter sp.]